MRNTTASPYRLRDGSWGIRIARAVDVGDSVTVETKSGKRWTATVERVVWSGTDRDGRHVRLCSVRRRSEDEEPPNEARYETRSRYASRSRYEPPDHEDCLTFGPCGPNCEYADIRRRKS